MTEWQAQIKGVVDLVSLVQGANPSPDESLFEAGVLDSFGLADLVAVLEREFHVKIPDSDLLPRNFSSIRAIESYLQKVEV